jgi:large subunit ribosomal protein L19
MNKLDQFNKKQPKKDLPEIRPGYTIRVHQKIKEGDRQRIQIFEGLVIARKHGQGINATITVRRVSQGIGVERIFPIHAPFIEKIEVVKKGKVRRSKLYYIRKKSAKESRLKEIKEKPNKEQTLPATKKEAKTTDTQKTNEGEPKK